ncbi:MAG: 50S ribosomal protein L4 [Nitrospirae bacterium]|nr:50S ribosomal protein L4 [Nitrospirota bacterium]
MAKVKVISAAGKSAGSVEVSDNVFGREANGVLLHEVVVRELAGMRQGTHATKTRGLVSGGGKKPWRQKGTGRARAGSNRSPLWKGGGTMFGPSPRDYSYRMPRKKVRAALYVALSDALREGRLTCIDVLDVDAPKTKSFVSLMAGLGGARGALVVVDQMSENLALASRNVPGVAVLEASDVTPYDLVVAERVVISKAAVEQLGGQSDEA